MAQKVAVVQTLQHKAEVLSSTRKADKKRESLSGECTVEEWLLWMVSSMVLEHV